MQQLQTELDRITGFAPAEQQRIVEKLRAKHSHTIVVANDITVARVPVRKFTCFIYAFVVYGTLLLSVPYAFPLLHQERIPLGVYVAKNSELIS